MKKFLFLFLIIGVSISEGKSQGSVEVDLMEKAIIEEIIDFNLSKSVNKIFDELNVDVKSIINETGIPSFAKGDFNFSTLYKCYIKDIDVFAVVAPFRSIGGAESFVFVAFQNKSGLSNPMLVRVNTDMNSMNYYDLSGGEVVTVVKSGDNVSAEISKINLSNQSDRVSNSKNPVMDCIHNMYHKFRLRSLWSWVHTALMPISGIVYVINCMNKTPFVDYK